MGFESKDDGQVGDAEPIVRHISLEEATSHSGGPGHPPSSSSPPPPPPDSEGHIRRAIIGNIGSVFEWMEFASFGFMAEYISDTFFPDSSKSAGLLETFAVFAGAFFMRPVGGVLLGYVGDKKGRKAALVTSIILMTVATVTTGMLPGYNTIGLWAPVLLTLCRMLQGLSVGGQLVSAILFTIESVPRANRGVFSGFAMGGATLGTALASGAAGILHATLSERQMKSWGWRIPFLASGVFGVVGSLMSHGASESPAFVRMQSQKGVARSPLRTALCNHTSSVLIACFGSAVWSCGIYITAVFIPNFEREFAEDHPLKGAYWINAVAGIALTLMFPVLGWVNDRLLVARWRNSTRGSIEDDGGGSRALQMAAGAAVMAVMAPLLFEYVLYKASRWPVLIGSVVLAMGMAFLGAPLCVWLCESFPVDVRSSSVGVAYNLSQSLFGGTAPLVATSLASKSDWRPAPGMYLSAVCLMSIAALIASFRRSNRQRPGRSDVRYGQLESGGQAVGV